MCPKEKSIFGTYRKYLDAINDAVLIVDKNHTIIDANIKCEEVLNSELKNIIGKKCHEVMSISLCHKEECPLNFCKINKKRFNFEIEFNKKYFRIIVDPVFDDDGNFDGSVHIILDVTANKAK